MDGGVRKALDYPLSDGDIRAILGDDISILTYPELEGRTLDQCFDRRGRCILLFTTNSPTSGHWCCLLKKKGGIMFWDPYGEAPEDQKDGLPRSRLEELDLDQPLLMRLLRKSGRPVYYNTYPYQKDKKGYNTCGRWCVARCLYADKSEEYFHSVVRSSGLEPDQFVVGLIANFLGK